MTTLITACYNIDKDKLGFAEGIYNEKSILDFSLYILEIIILFFDIMLNLI